jgi:hypothetical protein
MILGNDVEADSEVTTLAAGAGHSRYSLFLVWTEEGTEDSPLELGQVLKARGQVYGRKIN